MLDCAAPFGTSAFRIDARRPPSPLIHAGTAHLNVSRSLTSGRLLARNSLWNLLGQATPALIALIAVPQMLHGFGVERFGVLTLAWVFIGYFSLFDFGIGWALTKLVADRLGHGRTEDLAETVWSAWFAMFALGCAGALVVALVAPVLVERILHVPAALQQEAVRAFTCLAVALPSVTLGAGAQGVLAAHQRFGAINAIRIPLGILLLLGPIAVLPFSRSLVVAVGVLAALRWAACAAMLVQNLRLFPWLRRPAFRAGVLGELLRFGGWMTVSNVLGPLMVSVDRFVIGAVLSVELVAYYTTPYEMITRAWILSAPIVGVLFPAFAASFTTDPPRTRELFRWGFKAILGALLPVSMCVIALGHEGLNLWLGPAFASRSTAVLQWLAIGVFMNGLAQMAISLVQGTGHPRWSATLHLIELPFYLAGLWFLVHTYGIVGAAMAWTLRAGFDAVALFVMCHLLLGTEAKTRRAHAAGFGLSLALLAGLMQPFSLALRAVFLSAGLLAFGVLAWQRILVPGRRLLGIPPRAAG